mmetsp:Transcript_104177/g.300333  ORF Transcript_104177/g.300333 Transcript_104177/m.300333 type:complete len:176 (+) Transcript_104177:213-740(+)
MRAPPPPPPQAELEAEKEALEAQLEQERILAEKAEAQRLADLAAAEKKKKEEQIAYRELELKKLTHELESCQVEVLAAAEQLAAEEAKKTEELEWAKYTECDDKPDASSEVMAAAKGGQRGGGALRRALTHTLSPPPLSRAKSIRTSARNKRRSPTILTRPWRSASTRRLSPPTC